MRIANQMHEIAEQTMLSSGSNESTILNLNVKSDTELSELHVFFSELDLPKQKLLEFLAILSNSQRALVLPKEGALKNTLLKEGDRDQSLYDLTIEYLQENVDILNTIFNQKLEPKNKNFIFVKERSQLIKVALDEIQIIQALGDYVTLRGCAKKYIVHSSMKSIEDKLPTYFVRIHRSYIVNLNHIKSIEDSSLAIGDQVVPISKSYRSKLMSRLNIA